MSRIVVFGATGYTGRLVCEALVARGARPVLAARSEQKLQSLASELGGLDTVVADVDRPASVAALVEAGDVLVSTVGPFARWGRPAIDAAITKRAIYLDSTGEPGFIRDVFEEHGPRAQASGVPLLTALGYDWVPGHAAAVLALDQAGDLAVALDVGYFLTGDGKLAQSGGTRASTAGALTQRAFSFHAGQIVSERGGKRVAAFDDVDGARRSGVTVGATEHYSLPRVYPQLRDIDVFLGWFGNASRAVSLMGGALDGFMKLPGGRGLVHRLTAGASGSTGGPDAENRAKTGSHVVAIARDRAGQAVGEGRVEGVNAYTFTGAFLAWAAQRAAGGGVSGTGALGPVEAFGAQELVQGVTETGLRPLAR